MTQTPTRSVAGDRIPGPEESRVTATLLNHAAQMARECHANAILVYADVLPDGRWEPGRDLEEKIVFVTKTEVNHATQEQRGRQVIRVPNVALTRMGRVKIAVLLGLCRGLLQRQDTIICLSGVDESRTLDTLVVTEVGREFEMFLAPTDDEAMAPLVRPEVLSRMIDIVTDLGMEGREGKGVGALFVVGDTDRVLPLTRQLVLNPFQGYPTEARNVLDHRLEETIKEFSTIDGAFIVRGDGAIASAGTYLKTSGVPAEELPQGLGTRHQAAAAITSVTDSIALTVSQSTGTVTLFRKGRIVMELEKPRSRRV